jgi:hypothetical protein
MFLYINTGGYMNWIQQIRLKEPNRRNLLNIFGAYNRAINTVGENPEGIRWLYRASQASSSTKSSRWVRFCENIRWLYMNQKFSGHHQHQPPHDSSEEGSSTQEDPSQNENQELQRKIQQLQSVLQKKDEEVQQLEHSVRRKTKEIKSLKRKSLNEKNIKCLIKLCHPDKNKHRDAAAITRWLLELLQTS